MSRGLLFSGHSVVPSCQRSTPMISTSVAYAGALFVYRDLINCHILLQYFELIFFQLQLVKNLCKLIIIWVNYEKKTKRFLLYETPCRIWRSDGHAAWQSQMKTSNSSLIDHYFFIGKERETTRKEKVFKKIRYWKFTICFRLWWLSYSEPLFCHSTDAKITAASYIYVRLIQYTSRAGRH